MGSEIDARLARFGPRDVTVLATNGLLRVLPHADPLPPVQSMAEVVAALAGGAHPQAVQRAEQLVSEQNARRALLLATGLDAGDGIITVFSSIRSAVALYMGRHGGAAPPAGWSDHQAGDAVLKAIALGHLLDLCFPDSEDPVTELAGLPAGRALLAYYAAAEVALPFVEILVDGEHALSAMLPEHADAQARKLATVVGSAAVQEAREHMPALAPTADTLVACTASHLGPLAKTAEGTVPGARGVVDKVGDVVAAGADVLPVYRYLGLRVVAEVAALRAIREAGLTPRLSGDDWISKYIDAPRRAALPLPASVTSTGWEDPDTPAHMAPGQLARAADGGEGDDKLFGGAGDYNDWLKGGEGNDNLAGGNGKDVFIVDLTWDGESFASTDGFDRITDFDIDQDHDVLLYRVTTVGDGAGTSAQDAFAALDAAATVTDDGTNTRITIDGSNVKILGLTNNESYFSSLGQDAIPIGGVGINAVTTGDAGSYEAIRVLASDTGFDDSYDNIWGHTV